MAATPVTRDEFSRVAGKKVRFGHSAPAPQAQCDGCPAHGHVPPGGCGLFLGWPTGVEGFEEMVHLMHMILFLAMIVFLIEIVVLVTSTSRVLHEWREWEKVLHGRRLATTAQSLELKPLLSSKGSERSPRLRVERERACRRYELLRTRFIEQNQGTVGPDFDFAACVRGRHLPTSRAQRRLRARGRALHSTRSTC